jgi:hypothetical protein
MSTDQHFLIVPASGIGSRMNAQQPKQYLKLEHLLYLFYNFLFKKGGGGGVVDTLSS